MWVTGVQTCALPISSNGNNDHTSEQEGEKLEQTRFPIDETGLVNEVKF